jgi:hypothetical protein
MKVRSVSRRSGDRVVQTAAKIVLEPIFEEDFEDSAYGYRPRRSAIDAIKETHPQIGGPPHLRPKRAVADQAMAASAGRRSGTAMEHGA